MIRIVSSGDLGLDVLLGGGWRLVNRFEDKESATVVVRGGPGAGKTLMGIQVALELAKALGGDVAVGCVEILPMEYQAQLQSARSAFPRERVTRLPAPAASDDGPRIYIGLLADLNPDKPDLVAALEALDASVKAAGGNPKAFIVDSLIDGYGIGASTPRIDVDDVLKFAARYGHGLVLCEEVTSDEPSPWVFAADTVLHLGVESRERGRWIEVRKHRFGPSATGRHELVLSSSRGPAAIPAVHAWIAHRPQAQRAIGLDTARTDVAAVDLYWPNAPRLTGRLVSLTSRSRFLPEALALSLEPRRKQSLVMVLEPVETGPAASRPAPPSVRTTSIPTCGGVERAFRWMVEEIATAVDDEGEMTIDRVIVTDLQTVASTDSWSAWLDALRGFAQLLSPYDATVIVCMTLPADPARATQLGEQLASYAESAVSLGSYPNDPNISSVTAKISDSLTHVFDVVDVALPSDRNHGATRRT